MSDRIKKFSRVLIFACIMSIGMQQKSEMVTTFWAGLVPPPASPRQIRPCSISSKNCEIFSAQAKKISRYLVAKETKLLWLLVLTNHQYHEYFKNGKKYQKIKENRPPKTCPFYVYSSHFSWSIFIYKLINDTWRWLANANDFFFEKFKNQLLPNMSKKSKNKSGHKR